MRNHFFIKATKANKKLIQNMREETHSKTP